MTALSNAGQRQIAYWSIDTPISSYGFGEDTTVSDAVCTRAAAIRTRLNPFSTGTTLMPSTSWSPCLDSLAVDYLDSPRRLAAFSDPDVEAMISLSIGINMTVVVRR